MVNQCRNCGHFFQPTPNPRRPRLFCSDRCRKAWSRKHQIPQALRALRRWVRADGKRPIMCDPPAKAMELLPDAIYAEVSTSGHGLHVFVWSSEASFRRAGVEFYSHSRFIRMTGRRWPK